MVRRVTLTIGMLAQSDMGGLSLRRTLIQEALRAGFKLALDDAEMSSTVSEGAVH